MKYKNNEGFTLIEIIVAIVILSLAIIPILSYFIQSIDIVDQTENHSQALDIAIDSTEYFRNIIENDSYSDLTNLQVKMDDFSEAFNNNTNDNELSNYDKFTNYILDINAEEKDVYADNNNKGDNNTLIKITVDISWDDGKRDMKLDTLVRRR